MIWHIALVGFELLDGVVHARFAAVQHRPVLAQSLRLTDLGFLGLTRFAAVGAQGSWWFSRLQTSVGIFTADGRRAELEDLLAAPTAADGVEVRRDRIRAGSVSIVTRTGGEVGSEAGAAGLRVADA